MTLSDLENETLANEFFDLFVRHSYEDLLDALEETFRRFSHDEPDESAWLRAADALHASRDPEEDTWTPEQEAVFEATAFEGEETPGEAPCS